jgi:AAA15 family ATPase/GTPase
LLKIDWNLSLDITFQAFLKNKIEMELGEKSKAMNSGRSEIYLNDTVQQSPWCVLKYLSVKNYQGIKSLVIDNLPNDAQWIFLTGENGFGKTSVLRAIAKGLLGDEERVRQIDTSTKIESCISAFGNIFPQSVKKGKRNSYKADVDILGYGVARFGLNGDSNYGNAYSLFEDNGTLLNIENLLQTADKPTFEKIKNLFKEIIPNLADIKKIKKNGFYEIHYQEKTETGDTFDTVKLNELAAGYRGVITMIGDMIRHFNPSYDEFSFDEISGIVIIDEFDAHLHPKYQYELPNLLSKAFPNIQFIVSTHSPIPLLGVSPKSAVVFTVHRTREAGITIERLDDDIEIGRLSANSLLTSDIFGFKSIFARGSTPDTIEPFDDYKDIKDMNEMEKLLSLKHGLKTLNINI